METNHPGTFWLEQTSQDRPIIGVGTSLAGFMGKFQKGVLNQAVEVTSWADFVDKFGGIYKNTADYITAYCIRDFFKKGTRAYVVRVAHSDAEKSTINIPDTASVPVDILQVDALSEGLWSEGFDVVASAGTISGFKLVVKDADGVVLETFDNLSNTLTDSNYVLDMINGISQYVKITRLADITATKTLAYATYTLTGGLDGGTVTTAEYTGDQATKTGLYAFDAVDEMMNLSVPVDTDAVVTACDAYCASRGTMFFVHTAPKVSTTPALAKAWKLALTVQSTYASYYFPWLKVSDPLSSTSATLLIPADGYVLGEYASSDNSRGVHKAPGGVSTVSPSALGLAYNVSDAEQDTLNPYGLNCIRQFKGLGIVIWGVRVADLTDTTMIYVNKRRTLNYIKMTGQKNTRWTVFEPNDVVLRKNIVVAWTQFLAQMFKDGALVGNTASDAFFVVCDNTNNTASTRSAGQVITDIGVALSTPGEFIIFRISQKTAN